MQPGPGYGGQYPQQPQYPPPYPQPQHPQQQYPQQPFTRPPSGATAIIAGLLGLAMAGLLGYFPTHLALEYGLDQANGSAYVVLGLYLGAAVFAFIGALIVFFRSVAGAILLLIGAVLALVAILGEPVLLYDNEFGAYFEAMFSFGIEDAFVRIGGIALAPLVLVFAAIPPTLRYLNYRAPRVAPPGYPPPGW